MCAQFTHTHAHITVWDSLVANTWSRPFLVNIPESPHFSFHKTCTNSWERIYHGEDIIICIYVCVWVGGGTQAYESNSSQENDISSGKWAARAGAIERVFTGRFYKRLLCVDIIAYLACDLTMKRTWCPFSCSKPSFPILSLFPLTTLLD